MARPNLPPEEIRTKISISPDPRIVQWADEQCGLGKRFKNRTHVFEYAVYQLMETMDGEDWDAGGDRRRS